MVRLILLVVLVPSAALGQVLTTGHIFPSFVHGHAPGGIGSYQTELVLSNPNPVSVACSLRLSGFSARLEGLNGALPGPVSVVNFGIFPSGYEVIRTIGDQTIVAGLAVLDCTQPVYATSTVSQFAASSDSAPFAEANVPSSIGGRSVEYVFDQRNGSRLAIAIANPYNTPATFTVTFVGGLVGTRLLQVSAGGVIMRYLDELAAFPPNATGKAIISDSSLSRNVYSTGLKYSGAIFTGVLPNILLP